MKVNEIFKFNFGRGKIDTSKVFELSYFSTHININYHLDMYMNKNSNSIKNGIYYHNKIIETWNDELEANIKETVKGINFISKYPDLFINEHRQISFDNNKTFAYGGLIGGEINILSLLILVMAISEEENIEKALNSKEFDIAVNILKDYLQYIEEYTLNNQDSIIEFIKTRRLEVEVEPSDFDSLNLLVWKFFRDVEALKYAKNKTPWKYRRFANKMKDTLSTIYFGSCAARLNDFVF